MNAEERARLLREVELSGNCSHPIRLRGEMVNLATGEVGMSSLRVACKDRRQVVCPACSYAYRADAWILVASGLNGGKGNPRGRWLAPSTLRHADGTLVRGRPHHKNSRRVRSASRNRSRPVADVPARAPAGLSRPPQCE